MRPLAQINAQDDRPGPHGARPHCCRRPRRLRFGRGPLPRPSSGNSLQTPNPRRPCGPCGRPRVWTAWHRRACHLRLRRQLRSGRGYGRLPGGLPRVSGAAISIRQKSCPSRAISSASLLGAVAKSSSQGRPYCPYIAAKLFGGSPFMVSTICFSAACILSMTASSAMPMRFATLIDCTSMA